MAGMIRFMQLVDLLARALRPFLNWCRQAVMFVLGFVATAAGAVVAAGAAWALVAVVMEVILREPGAA